MKILTACVFTLILFSCSKEKQVGFMPKPVACDSARFTFDADILPILNANCNFHDCHAPAGAGAYDFTKYAVIADRIRAGVVEYRIELPKEDPQHMPMEYSLSLCDYYRLKLWILQGYPKN
jgi:hypothetical protein